MLLIISSGLVIFVSWVIIIGLIGSFQQWSFEEISEVDNITILFIILILKGIALSVYFSLHTGNTLLSVISILWILLEIVCLIFTYEIVITKKKGRLLIKIYEKVFLPVFNDKDTIAYIQLKSKINHWTFSGLEDYDDVQAIIRYHTKLGKMNAFQYTEFIANVYFGYSNGDIHEVYDKISQDLPKWIKSDFYHRDSIFKGLFYRDWVDFSVLNYDKNEQEIIATKYLTAFQTIQSLIGLKPNKEVRAKVIELLETYAKELSEGIVEIRETEERMKQEEHMVYEKQQERLKELMENVLELYKKP